MKINNSYILLKEIRCYAYHGVAPQENLIGNEYIIDLKLKVNISKAAQTDEVADTVNYAEVHHPGPQTCGSLRGFRNWARWSAHKPLPEWGYAPPLKSSG